MAANTDRKRSAEWVRGQDDGYRGCPPDLGQANVELMQDYIDGYRKGKAEREREAERK